MGEGDKWFDMSR